MNLKYNLPLLAYLTICIVWGTTYLVIRIAVKNFPPETFGGIRFLIAGTIVLIFWSILKISKIDSAKIETSNIKNSIFEGLLMLGGGHGLVVFSEQWVHSGITALVLSTDPIMIAVLEWIFLRKSVLNIWGWLGLFIGFTGVTMTVFFGKTLGNIDIKGAFLLLLACLLFAIGSIFSKKNSKKGSVLFQVAIQMITGGFCLLMIGFFTGEFNKIVFNFTTVWTMAYLILFGSIIGYGSYIYLLKHWSASKAGTYSYINTIIAIILGAIILKEPLSLSMIFAMLITTVGVIMVQFSKKSI